MTAPSTRILVFLLCIKMPSLNGTGGTASHVCLNFSFGSSFLTPVLPGSSNKGPRPNASVSAMCSPSGIYIFNDVYYKACLDFCQVYFLISIFLSATISKIKAIKRMNINFIGDIILV